MVYFRCYFGNYLCNWQAGKSARLKYNIIKKRSIKIGQTSRLFYIGLVDDVVRPFSAVAGYSSDVLAYDTDTE